VRVINKLIIHCSESTFGDVETIRKWHVDGNGWDDIGYHYVIKTDGEQEIGRPIQKQGAHCYGQNKHSIGICLIGTNKFNKEQKKSLEKLIILLCRVYEIPFTEIYGHNDFTNKKTCPNFDVGWIREFII